MEKYNIIKCPSCGESHFINKNDTYLCQVCNTPFYKVTTEEQELLYSARRDMFLYKFEEADTKYEKLYNETNNESAKAQALFGRFCAYYGIVRLRDMQNNILNVFTNYYPNEQSIKDNQYYKIIMQSKYKEDYNHQFNILEKEYQVIHNEFEKSEEYDFFICSKVTQSLGEYKTQLKAPEYTEALSLCMSLQKFGKKVFFCDTANIKGDNYDAPIISALIRSKNIIIVSSSQKYLESPWVQSEWRRWLKFIKNKKKAEDSITLYTIKNYEGIIPPSLNKVNNFTDQSKLLTTLCAKSPEEELEIKLKKAERMTYIDLNEAEEIYKKLCKEYDDNRPWIGLLKIKIKQRISPDDTQINILYEHICNICKDDEKEDIIQLFNQYKKSFINISDTINKQETVINKKKYSQNLEYELNEDKKSYSVIGIGECKDTEIIIPSLYNGLNVVNIAEEAFYNCREITKIEIPNSVTSIGEGAFSYCSSLETINVDPNNKTYDSRNNCNAIIETSTNELILGCKNTIIPKTITSIGSSAFEGCSNLISVIIPFSVTSIEWKSFSGCSSLTSITLPNSVTSIGWAAFEGCSSLTNITLPNSVEKIGYSSFRNCTSLKYNEYYNALYLGNTVNPYVALVKVKSNDISKCIIHKNTKIISDNAFENCDKLKNVIIANSVTNIGKSSFSDCSSLTSVILPNSVTSIGDHAFSMCNSLKNITLSDGVKNIGVLAFHQCMKLKKIIISNSVKSIGNCAFWYCSSLTIYCEVSSKPDSWHKTWNPDDRPVIWGYRGSK